MDASSLSNASTSFTRRFSNLRFSNSIITGLPERSRERPKQQTLSKAAEPRVAKLALILERLPPELYMKIIRNINPTEGILLSLTCKTLWARATLQSTDVLYKLKRCSPLDQTTHFLRMLEKDRSRYVACTLCLKLHFRLPDELQKLIQIGLFFNTPRGCSQELGVVKTLGPITSRLQISREALELVLRSGALGADYGLVLGFLRKAFDWEVFSETHLKVHMESAASIVPVPGQDDSDGHLFLKITYSVEVDLRRDVFSQIKAAKIGGCGHVSSSSAEARYMKWIIDRAVAAPTNSDVLAAVQSPCCPTDMFVKASYKPTEVFVRVDVTAFRDLGPRGDHKMEIWRRQVASDLDQVYDRSMIYTFGNQPLQLLYERAQKVVCTTE